LNPIFYCKFPISRHPSQKNEKVIHYKRRTQTPFIGSTKGFIIERHAMMACLKQEMVKQSHLLYPITDDVHIKFTFYFPNYYTVKNLRNRKLPDLSNLYHFPEDCLQNVGIIENDSLICSHDGSRRLPSDDQFNHIEISIWTLDSDAKQ
jgi:Holliday junction resolvase RusA-like endonuclease